MNCLVCNVPTVNPVGHPICPSCGLVKVNAPVSYDFDNYTRTYQSLLDTDLERRINVGRVGMLMRHVKTGSRVLDFGCSCGNFLKRLEEYGYLCFGYEPSQLSGTVKTCKAPIFNNLNEIRATSEWDKFDLITLFDVIEHFPDPYQGTALLCDMIRPGGHLYVTTPDPSGLNEVRLAINPLCSLPLDHSDRPLLSFYHLKPGEHTHLWTPSSLNGMMNSFGMSPIYSGHEEGTLRQKSGYDKDIVTVIYKKKG